MIKRIWVIGASVRALAQTLVAAGYEVVASDLFCDIDLRRVAETHQLRNFPHDALVHERASDADAWMYAGGLENYPELVATLSELRHLLGNSAETLRTVRDAENLAVFLAEHGFQMPEIRCNEHVNEPGWLRKSERSSGGMSVQEYDPREPLGSGEYLQKFVEGGCYGATFLADQHSCRLVGVAQAIDLPTLTHAPGFVYSGSIGPIQLPVLQTELERLGKELQKWSGLLGLFGVDFIIDHQSKLWVLEVNPRYTASIEVFGERAGSELAKAYITACSGGRLPNGQLLLPNEQTTKAVLYATRSLKVETHHLEKLLDADAWPVHMADIPVAGTIVQPGQPILTLLASGPQAPTEQLRTSAVGVYELLEQSDAV